MASEIRHIGVNRKMEGDSTVDHSGQKGHVDGKADVTMPNQCPLLICFHINHAALASTAEHPLVSWQHKASNVFNQHGKPRQSSTPTQACMFQAPGFRKKPSIKSQPSNGIARPRLYRARASSRRFDPNSSITRDRPRLSGTPQGNHQDKMLSWSEERSTSQGHQLGQLPKMAKQPTHPYTTTTLESTERSAPV